ncbi:MAG: protein phosphatase 2C domain-containing protein [Saprospiraceae bacterium]|nr:protein phosphatase 2C domain-containing protein [Saprospiraceae bacterium]
MKSLIFTHKGKRKINQDFVLIQNINPDTFLMLIADGMGGYEQGEKAAKAVAESILTFLSTTNEIGINQIQKAINKANLVIKQMTIDSQVKMGATIGGIILNKNSAICFWVGDVKIFHFNNNKLQYESHSHTLMNEIIENGSIKDPERISKFKHVVTRSVQGDIKHSQIDFHEIENLSNDDMFLICSDGVHDLYDGIHFQQLLNNSSTIEEAINCVENRLMLEAEDNFSLMCKRAVK